MNVTALAPALAVAQLGSSHLLDPVQGKRKLTTLRARCREGSLRFVADSPPDIFALFYTGLDLCTTENVDICLSK